MTVYTPSLPNSNTQDDSTYKNAIDNTARIHDVMGGAFAPHQTGNEVSPSGPDMTVTLEAGYLLNGTTLTSVSTQTTGVITAPVSNPRIDRVVVDSTTGAVSVIAGSEAASPTAPAITAGKLPVAQVLLATSSTSITNSMITDERVGFHSSSSVELGVTAGKAVQVDQSETSTASATTTTLGTTLKHLITGTTTITAFNGVSGVTYHCTAGGGFTLTHHATNLDILQTGANITTAADDTFDVYMRTGSTCEIRNYQRASGEALVTASGYEFVATASASGTASVDIGAGLITSGYDYYLNCENIQNSADLTPANAPGIQFGTGAGPTYQTSGYVNSITQNGTATNETTARIAFSGGFTNIGGAAGEIWSGEMYLPNLGSSVIHQCRDWCMAHFTDGTPIWFSGGGWRTTAEIVTGLRIIVGTGTIDTGTFNLYRRKRS